jgi:hypothetical protein
MSIPFHSSWSEFQDLPTAWVEAGSGDPYAHHPLAGWRMKAEVYLDGSIRPLSAEFGSRYFAPAPFHPGHRQTSLIVGDTVRELDLQRLPGVRWMLGPGSAQATVPMDGGYLHLEVVIENLDARDLLVCWSWHAARSGVTAPSLLLPTNLAGAVRRNNCLGVDLPHYGRVGWAAQGAGLAVREEAWRADLTSPLLVRVGYDPTGADPEPPSIEQFAAARAANHRCWRELLGRVHVRPGAIPWRFAGRRSSSWAAPPTMEHGDSIAPAMVISTFSITVRRTLTNPER